MRRFIQKAVGDSGGNRVGNLLDRGTLRGGYRLEERTGALQSFLDDLAPLLTKSSVAGQRARAPGASRTPAGIG